MTIALIGHGQTIYDSKYILKIICALKTSISEMIILGDAAFKILAQKEWISNKHQKKLTL